MNEKKFYEKRKFSGEHNLTYLIASNFANKLIKNRKIRYLDVGCSDGYGIGIFVKNTDKDIDAYGVDIVKPNNKKSGFKFKKADVSRDKFPFKENSFDVITSFEVIEHVYDTAHYIQEIRRVLKKDGLLFISTPNLSWWLNRILLLFGYQPANTEVDLYNSMFGKPKIFKNSVSAGHIRVFTKKALDEFLIHYGFKILNTVPMNNMYPGFVGKFVSFFDKIFPIFCDCSYRYIYVLKKI